MDKSTPAVFSSAVCLFGIIFLFFYVSRTNISKSLGLNLVYKFSYDVSKVFPANIYLQGVIQTVFEIGYRFWRHENLCPNLEYLAKTNISVKLEMINFVN